MSTANDQPYWAQSRRGMLRGWVLSEMMRGAGYAALTLLVIGLSMWAIHLVGMLLPADSKTAPPPMPFSMVLIDASAQV
jgi:NO-binding membrane sensor protein with MHYT domain